MGVDRTLSSPDTINARLAHALEPPLDKDRFTFLNAGVGRSHTFFFGTENAKCNNKVFCPGLPMVSADTPGAIAVETVDVPFWLSQHYREEDHIVIKCDAEGGEHGLLEGIIKLKVAKLIDTLAIECHNPIGNCLRLIKEVRTMNPNMKLLFEKHGYKGWDSAFDANEFYPTDPRND